MVSTGPIIEALFVFLVPDSKCTLWRKTDYCGQNQKNYNKKNKISTKLEYKNIKYIYEPVSMGPVSKIRDRSLRQ